MFSQELTPYEFQKVAEETTITTTIPYAHFFDIETINSETNSVKPFLHKLENLSGLSDEQFQHHLAKLFESVSETKQLLQICFQLVSRTNSKRVYNFLERNWDTKTVSQSISHQNGDSEVCLELTDALQQIGLQTVIDSWHLPSFYVGTLGGFESDKRKNRQGNGYENFVEIPLKEGIDEINSTMDTNLSLHPQYPIEYESGTKTKILDFVIKNSSQQPILACECNCYSSKGSKISEIERAYELVHKEISNENVHFLWVNDGKGDFKEKYKAANGNIYTLQQARENIVTDIKTIISSNPVPPEYTGTSNTQTYNQPKITTF